LRDSDWFRFVASGDSIHLEAQASFFVDMACDVMYIEDCQDISVLPFQMGFCSGSLLDIPTTPGEVVHLRVRPISTTRAMCAPRYSNYTLKLNGIQSETTAVPEAKPAGLILYANTPNPLNPRTTIRYELPERAPVTLRIFDLSGRLVDVLVEGEVLTAGTHTATWTGRDSQGRAMPSGTYFYRLEAGGYSETRRMTLIR